MTWWTWGDDRVRTVSKGHRFVAAILMLPALGCGDAQPPTAPRPHAEQYVALRLTGPATIPPGGSGQFTAIGERSDGSTADLTDRVKWSSSPALLSFDGAGLGRAAADARGETRVTAVFQVYPTQTMAVLLLEPGTFRISGTVTNSGFSVGGAVIEVVDGTGSGLRATTDYSGRFELFGVAGSIKLRISADGFEPATVSAIVSDHTTANFTLKPLVSQIDLGGTWTMTATAAAACRSMLPEAAWQGEIEVVVAHHDTRPQIQFPGPITWTGRLINGVITFLMGGPEDPMTHTLTLLPIKPVSQDSWLEVGGVVTADVARDEIVGTIDGTFRVAMERTSGVITCTDRHQMTMRRR